MKAGVYFHFLDFSLLKDIENLQAVCDKGSHICNVFQYRKKINVVKIYNFQQFNKMFSIKIPRWVIGTGYDSTILLLDKLQWKDPNIMSVDSLILHEMVHIILANYCKVDLPIWLNEGLAVVLSGQKMSYDKKLIMQYLEKKDIYSMGYEDNMLYQCAGFAVKAIIAKYGLYTIAEDMKYFVVNEYWNGKVLHQIIEEFED